MIIISLQAANRTQVKDNNRELCEFLVIGIIDFMCPNLCHNNAHFTEIANK